MPIDTVELFDIDGLDTSSRYEVATVESGLDSLTSGYGLSETLVKMTPLVLAAVAVAVMLVLAREIANLFLKLDAPFV